MRYLLLSVLLLFSVSVFAADGIMPDGWDTAAVKLVSADTTGVPLVPERIRTAAGAIIVDEGTATAAAKLVCYWQPAPVMTAQLTWEVGWRQ